MSVEKNNSISGKRLPLMSNDISPGIVVLISDDDAEGEGWESDQPIRSKDDANEEEAARKKEECRGQSGWHRGSIFTEAAEEELKSILGDKASEILLESSVVGIPIQILLILSVIALCGTHPILMQIVVRRPDEGQQHFNLFAVNIMHFTLSAACCFTFSVLANVGREGFKGSLKQVSAESLRIKSLLLLLPISACLASVEAVDLLSIKMIDAAVKGTIHQLKLPIAAVVDRFCLVRKPYPMVQWCIISAITSSVMGFTIAKAGGLGLAESLNRSSAFGWGVALTLLQILIAIVGLASTDLLLKKGRKISTAMRITQLRIDAAIIAVICWSISSRSRGGESFFQGWTPLLWLLVLLDIMKDWMTIALLKRMGSLWRAIAGSMSVIVTFALDSLMRHEWEPIAGMFIFLILCQGVGLALAQAEAKRRLKH